MKVRVNVTVDVDQQKWADEYGLDRADVRADVRALMQQECDALVERLGLEA